MRSVSSDIQSPRNDINDYKTRGGVFISYSNTEKKMNKTKRMRALAFSHKVDLSMLHRTLIFVKMVKFLIVKAIEICNNIPFTFIITLSTLLVNSYQIIICVVSNSNCKILYFVFHPGVHGFMSLN